MLRHLVALAFPIACLAAAPSAVAEVFVPGQSVPRVSSDVFTWAQDQQHSTSAFWHSFANFPGGSIPGGIAPGISPEANETFVIGASPSSLTFNSFATIISSGNAYGFNFAPGQPAFQPDFITDAFATVRSGTTGGNHTRIVAQWQTQGSELDYPSILLSFDPAIEGTVAPDLSLETERRTLGGFGGELITRLAVWDLNTSQEAFRVDFNAQANHMSFDEFRIDTFTQNTPFIGLRAIPEPSGLAVLGIVSAVVATRRRRTQ